MMKILDHYIDQLLDKSTGSGLEHRKDQKRRSFYLELH